MKDKPVRKQNRLPLREYSGVGAYSLTLATAARRDWFSEREVTGYCLDALRATATFCSFLVYAYCFMPDHLHLLVGTDEENGDLIDFVKRFKQKTGWWFSQRARAGGLKASPTSLWQRSFYDHVIRSEESLRTAAEYVIGNPVASELTDVIGKYPYAGSFVWPDLNPSIERASM